MKVVIASGKGGTGKTTVAANLAVVEVNGSAAAAAITQMWEEITDGLDVPAVGWNCRRKENHR